MMYLNKDGESNAPLRPFFKVSNLPLRTYLKVLCTGRLLALGTALLFSRLPPGLDSPPEAPACRTGTGRDAPLAQNQFT